MQCLHASAPRTNPRAPPQPSIDIGSLHRIRRLPHRLARPIDESHNKTGPSTALHLQTLKGLLGPGRSVGWDCVESGRVCWLCVSGSPLFQNGGTGGCCHWLDLRSGEGISGNWSSVAQSWFLSVLSEKAEGCHWGEEIWNKQKTWLEFLFQKNDWCGALFSVSDGYNMVNKQ